MIRSILLAVLMTTAAYGQLSSKAEKYHAWMPPTDDPGLAGLFDDPAIEWYTRQEIPAVYQHQLGGHSWIDIHKKISPPDETRLSNGNREWPWDHPAVLATDHDVKNIVGVKLVGVRLFDTRFAKYTLTNYHDGRGWRNPRVIGSEPGVGWEFAPGTEFVELVTTKIGRGDSTFKVHRMTMTDSKEWEFRVYRPVRSVAQYERLTGTKVGPPVRRRLRDPFHSMPALDVTANQHEITEPISAKLAAEILARVPFRLCTDEDFIPTTRHADQIWPRGYIGAFIGNATDQANCRNCHRDVAVNVAKFDAGNWYGQIRGGGKDKHGAGVFSWRPKLTGWYGMGQRRSEAAGHVQQLQQIPASGL